MKFAALVLLSLASVSYASAGTLECRSSGKYLHVKDSRIELASYEGEGYLNQFSGSCAASPSASVGLSQACSGANADGAFASLQLIESGQELLAYSVVRVGDAVKAKLITFDVADCSVSKN